MLKETRRFDEDSYESIMFDIIENGVTVGYASVMTDERQTYCDRIDIVEPYRNNGFGTKALYELSHMFDGVIVAPDNENAKRLYERIGSESNKDMYDQGFGVYEI